MSSRRHPDLKELIEHLILSIATHPLVENSGIYYPTPSDESTTPQQINITQFRNYGGPVLEEPGLVCSVYPYHTPRDAMVDSPSPWSKQTIHYDPYSLGRPGEGSIDDALYRIVVELSFQDALLSSPAQLHYLKVKPTNLSPEYKHAYRVILKEDNKDFSSEDLRRFNPDAFLQRGTIDIVSSPGEEVLRMWVDRIRQVISCIETFLPFRVRNLRVDDVDFPTTRWSESGNINFHSAYLTCSLNIYVHNGFTVYS